VLESLASGATWSVGHFACRAHRHAPALEECAASHHIGFVRRGLFVKQVHRHETTADAMQAVFFPRGEVYRVYHPLDGGDDCVVLTLDDDFLRALADDAGDGCGADRPTLPAGATRLDAQGFLALTQLFVNARRGWEPLAMEEDVCRLAAAAILGARPRRLPAPPIPRDRRERVREVQALMSARFDRRLALSALASAVGWSPFQLMRAFRAVTGRSVHRHLIDLRLAAATARLADGADDLTMLALDCGFADHSHFANVFRRHARLTPSAARGLLSRSPASR
jgi:AraC-like DNA-binding protein